MTSNLAPLLGRYQPLVKLGTGGMADVFLAMSRTTGGLEKLAVLKRLRPDIGEDPEEIAHFKGMFWDEAKLAMLLNHSNVVHTHDAYEEAGALHLVMEYIEGQSLNKVVRELDRRGRRLTVAQSAFIMSEVLAGLHYAHELKSLTGERLNIVHRDVSPQNILLSYDGNIKLVDFGVAMASSRSTETRAGTLKGKARYMAPEQVITKGTLDRRADVYAVGVVLWELVAGRKLVEGANMVEQLVNVIKVEPERLSKIVPGVDPALDEIVHRALARAPEDRFQTAQEMRDALTTVANREGAIRPADIGVLLNELFAEKREEIAKIVRERLALEAARSSLGRTSTPDVPVVDEQSERSLVSGLSGLSAPRSIPTTATSASSFTPHATVQPVDPEPPSSRSSKKTVNLLVACLLVLLLAVGGLSGVVFSSMRSGTVTASRAPETATAKALEPKPTDPIGESQPKAEAPEAKSTASSTKAAEPERPAPAQAGAAPRVAAPAFVPRAPSPVPAPQPDARPTSTPAPAVTAPEGEGGFVTIDTYPWTTVSENGRVLGNTPLVRIPMSAGVHVLTLENPQENVRQTATVVVKPGESVSKRFAF